MKKLLTFMLMMIGMVLMSTLTTSCRNHQESIDPDSLWVANIVNDVNHAEFTSDKEFMLYLVDKRDQAYADSIVFRLHDQVVAGICHKILDHGGKISIRSVCDEYLANKDFYNGMNEYLAHPITNKYRNLEVPDTINIGGELNESNNNILLW